MLYSASPPLEIAQCYIWHVLWLKSARHKLVEIEMSREGIIAELSQFGVSVQELKYSAPRVSVYRGQYYNAAAAVKVLPWQQGTDYTGLEKECTTMQSLTHPNILTLLNAFWLQQQGQAYFVIVTEWCEKDLDKDIQQRAQNTFPFKEAELLDLFCQTIDALAFMQAQGLAHRDLKPQNIFLTLSKSIKIGDFGSTSWNTSEFGELVGTPYYLSPLLKQALLTSQVAVQHNSFKSDVYSLGLTFLAAAVLGTSPVFIKQITDEAMAREIGVIQYSDEVKTLLRAMLGCEEDNRWDFLQLRKWICSRSWGAKLNAAASPISDDTLLVHKAPKSNTESERTMQITGAFHQPKAAPAIEDQSINLASQVPVQVLADSKPPPVVPQDSYVPVTQKPNVTPADPSQLTESRFQSVGLSGAQAVPPDLVVLQLQASPKQTGFGISQVGSTGELARTNQRPGVQSQQTGTSQNGAKSARTCMQCRQTLDRSMHATTVIQLYCQPDQHMYCSAYCFVQSLASMSTSTPECPKCREKVDEDLRSYYTQMDLLFPHCLICHLAINVKSEAEKAALPKPTCRNPHHVCCSVACMAQIKGICQLCRNRDEENSMNPFVPFTSANPRSAAQSVFTWLIGLCYRNEGG